MEGGIMSDILIIIFLIVIIALTGAWSVFIIEEQEESRKAILEKLDHLQGDVNEYLNTKGE